jgi:hypothetical protein
VDVFADRTNNSPWLAGEVLLPCLLICGCGGASEEVDLSPDPAPTFRAELRDLDTDLELHWSFEDRSGSQITDLSGNGRHGTLSGGSFISSPWGEAVSLDGVDDEISFPNLRSPSMYGGVDGSYTVSARVRVDDVSEYNTLCFGCGPLAEIYVGTTSGAHLLTRVDDQNSSTDIWVSSNDELTSGTWVTVTMVVEGGVGVRYYLDGELDKEITNTNVGLEDFNYSSVGEGQAGRWFAGEIDDLRVWSRALTEDELWLTNSDPADPMCSGAPEAATFMTPPTPPQSYTEPSGVCANDPDCCVTDAGELETAIASSCADIILADGNYTHTDLSGNWLTLKGNRLWAENLGGATLDFGISAGGVNVSGVDYSGAELHGLVFDIDDADHVPKASTSPSAPSSATAFLAWDDAVDLVVADCVFLGNAVIDRAISVETHDGFEVSRVEIDDFRRFGIHTPTGGSAITTAMEISDVTIYHIGDPPCWGVELSSCNYYPGTQENGIHLEDTANVSRVFIRDVRANGVVTAQKTDGSVLTNLDIDRIGVPNGQLMGVGVLFEDTTKNTIVKDFCVGPYVRNAVNSEWDNNDHPHGIGNTVQNGLSQSWFIGVHFDQGTEDGLVQNMIFRGYERAGVNYYNTVNCTLSNNTFQETEIAGTTCDYTETHWLTAPTCVTP